MKWFGRFRKPPPSTAETVRQALKVCVEGVEPELSTEEFESLYTDVLRLEHEGNRYNAVEMIGNFLKQRKFTKTDGVGCYERTATVIVNDDGSKCVQVGLINEHNDDEMQYILHELLNTIGRLELAISCTVDDFVERQKKSTLIISKHD